MTGELMTSSVEILDTLARERVLEAAGYLAESVSVGDLPEDYSDVLRQFADEPYGHLAEIEEVARLVLAVALTGDDTRDAALTAIGGTGRKQVIIGGAEIVTLAAIALAALHTMLTKGKASTRTKIRIEADGDRTTVTIDEQVTYGMSPRVGGLIRQALTHGVEQGTDSTSPHG